MLTDQCIFWAREKGGWKTRALMNNPCQTRPQILSDHSFPRTCIQGSTPSPQQNKEGVIVTKTWVGFCVFLIVLLPRHKPISFEPTTAAHQSTTANTTTLRNSIHPHPIQECVYLN